MLTPALRVPIAITSILILCACGQSVTPDRSMTDGDGGASVVDAQPTDASAPGVSAIFVGETWTVALDAQRRAYSWGFFASHEDPARVYQRPAREPALDGALAVRSLYATITCGLVAEDSAGASVRCAAGTHPFAELPWARGARSIALTTGREPRLWARMPDGFVRFSQPLSLMELARSPSVRLDGFVDGLSDARSLACAFDSCCASTARGELVCWGDDPANVRPASVEPRAARSIGRATRVAQSAVTRTACAQREGDPLFCWGLGTHSAFGFSAPNATDPSSMCAVEGAARAVDCVRYPGASFEGVFIDPADGARSTALVLRTADRAIVVEAPARSWLRALDPQPIVTRVGAIGAPVALRGLRPETPFAISGGHACWAFGDRVRCAGGNAQAQLGVDRRATRASDDPIEVPLAP